MDSSLTCDSFDNNLIDNSSDNIKKSNEYTKEKVWNILECESLDWKKIYLYKYLLHPWQLPTVENIKKLYDYWFKKNSLLDIWIYYNDDKISSLPTENLLINLENNNIKSMDTLYPIISLLRKREKRDQKYENFRKYLFWDILVKDDDLEKFNKYQKILRKSLPKYNTQHITDDTIITLKYENFKSYPSSFVRKKIIQWIKKIIDDKKEYKWKFEDHIKYAKEWLGDYFTHEWVNLLSKDYINFLQSRPDLLNILYKLFENDYKFSEEEKQWIKDFFEIWKIIHPEIINILIDWYLNNKKDFKNNEEYNFIIKCLLEYIKDNQLYDKKILNNIQKYLHYPRKDISDIVRKIIEDINFRKNNLNKNKENINIEIYEWKVKFWKIMYKREDKEKY